MTEGRHKMSSFRSHQPFTWTWNSLL